MTREMLMDAVSALDSEALDQALCERARLLPRATRRIKPLTAKWMGVAACFLAVLLVLPIAQLVFSGSNETAPDTRFFASVAEAEAALGDGLLLDRLEGALTRTDDIRVTYTTDYYIGAEGPGNASQSGGGVDKPLMLVASYKVTDTMGDIDADPLPVTPVETSAEQEGVDPVPEETEDQQPSDEWDVPVEESPSDGDGPTKDESPDHPVEEWEDVTSVKLYILFDCDSVEDSSIGGYEEQGLTQWYGDIVVHYSVIRDPRPHGQAKFLYGGDLYVLDVVSSEAYSLLFRYMDLLLKGVNTP